MRITFTGLSSALKQVWSAASLIEPAAYAPVLSPAEELGAEHPPNIPIPFPQNDSTLKALVPYPREAFMLAAWPAASAPLFGGAWTTLNEVPARQGVIDVVHVAVDPEEAARRRQGGQQPILSGAQLTVMLLGTDSFSVSEIAEISRLDPSHLARSVLPRLADLGWLYRTREAGSIRWLKARRYHIPVSQLIAVEFKREQWKRALVQGARHVEAVDASWVILDAATAGTARMQHQVWRHANVGLGLLSWDGSITSLELVHRPAYIPPERRNPLARALLAEQCHSMLGARNPSAAARVFGRDLEAEAIVLGLTKDGSAKVVGELGHPHPLKEL